MAFPPDELIERYRKWYKETNGRTLDKYAARSDLKKMYQDQSNGRVNRDGTVTRSAVAGGPTGSVGPVNRGLMPKTTMSSSIPETLNRVRSKGRTSSTPFLDVIKSDRKREIATQKRREKEAKAQVVAEEKRQKAAVAKQRKVSSLQDSIRAEKDAYYAGARNKNAAKASKLRNEMANGKYHNFPKGLRESDMDILPEDKPRVDSMREQFVESLEDINGYETRTAAEDLISKDETMRAKAKRLQKLTRPSQSRRSAARPGVEAPAEEPKKAPSGFMQYTDADGTIQFARSDGKKFRAIPTGPEDGGKRDYRLEAQKGDTWDPIREVTGEGGKLSLRGQILEKPDMRIPPVDMDPVAPIPDPRVMTKAELDAKVDADYNSAGDYSNDWDPANPVKPKGFGPDANVDPRYIEQMAGLEYDRSGQKVDPMIDSPSRYRGLMPEPVSPPEGVDKRVEDTRRYYEDERIKNKGFGFSLYPDGTSPWDEPDPETYDKPMYEPEMSAEDEELLRQMEEDRALEERRIAETQGWGSLEPTPEEDYDENADYDYGWG